MSTALHWIPRTLPIFCAMWLLPVQAPPAQAQPGEASLQPMEPVRCSRTDRVQVHGRLIKATGPAIQASGSCRVEVVGSQIESTRVAIQASGSARISIVDSTVQANTAIQASGGSSVTYQGSRVQGRVQSSGMSSVSDLGQSSSGAATASTAPGAAPDHAGGGGAVVSDDLTSVTLGPGGVIVNQGGEQTRIRADGSGVDVQGPRGERVVTGADGQIAATDGHSVVRVDGDWVAIRHGQESADVRVTPDGVDWRSRRGSVRISGDAQQVIVDLGGEDRDGEVHVDLTGDVLFDFGAASLRPEATETLAKVAQLIRQRAKDRVELIGHTDSIGAADANLQLSLQRAVEVMRWLNEREGIPAEIMVGQGMGSKKPVAHNTNPDGSDSPEGRAKNRRVEVRIR